MKTIFCNKFLHSSKGGIRFEKGAILFMKVPYYSFLLLIFILPLTGCLNDTFVPPVTSNCDTTYYQQKIRPIITKHCSNSGCHNGLNGIPNYNQYFELKIRVEDQVDGVPEILYRLRLPLNDPEHMPKDIALPPEKIAEIEKWINNGYQGCDL